jgi:hypothetical protein
MGGCQITRRRRVSHDRRRLLVQGLVALGVACKGDPVLPDPPDPEKAASDVESVQIVPPSVWVTPGAEFVLRARVLRKGFVLDPGSAATPLWSAGPATTVTVEGIDGGVAEGVGVVVRVPADASGAGTVKVALGNRAATAQVTVLAATSLSSTSDDVVWDDRKPAALTFPGVVLAEGTVGSGPCPAYHVAAYAGAAPVGNLTSACYGDVSLFTQSQGLEFTAHQWQDAAGEQVHLPVTNPLLPTPVNEMHVVVRAAVTPTQGFEVVEAAVRSALRHAAGVYDSNRVGLTFVLAGDKVHDIRTVQGDDWVPEITKSATGYVCPGPKDLTHKDSLVVFVVAGLSVGGASGYKGFTCARSPTEGQVIFVAFPHLALTLAHELGHATIGPGHPKLAEGFPSDNLLVLVPPSATGAPPGHVSIGQAFRATRGAQSWWNARTVRPGTRDCAVVDCPPVSLDPGS